MSSRPRSLRAGRLPLKRSLRPLLEDLEIRVVLSTMEFSATPTVVRNYYGVNGISFGGTTGTGANETIAIVDPYDDPGLVNSTAANFGTSDLAEFDKYFNVPNLPTFSFTKVSETGSTTPPGTDPTGQAEIQEAMDVEWAHAIAPGASIVLVECSSASESDILTGVQYAATIAPVVAVNASLPEYTGDTALNADFDAPNVTYLAATGNAGSSGQSGDTFAEGGLSFLNNVVSVGGTSLLTENGSPVEETGWADGAGGVSIDETEPAYQEGVQSSHFREAPDVSMDADPSTGGVPIYDSYNFGMTNPLGTAGGTGLATSMWAGLIAIADQGRVMAGGTPLTGSSQTLPALYSLPSYDFNDIVAGNNEGHNAGPGYDMVTGLGSPRANLLVPDLAAYQMAGSVAVTVAPPSSVEPGQTFGLSAALQGEFASTDTSFDGTATLTPSLAGSTPITAPVVNGQVVFDGLTLAAGQSSSYTISITVNGTTLSTTTGVVTGSTATVPASSIFLYPAPSYASLNTALTTAATDSAANVTIVLQSGIYALDSSTPGSLVIQNQSSLATKTITIEGDGPGSTIIEPSDDNGWTASIFEIIGKAGSQVQVNMTGLTIEDGEATSGGSAGAAVGGGLLIDGGTVSLSQVALVHDVAVGAEGTVGATAKRKARGGAGGSGKAARGGGLYMSGGSLSLVGVSFVGDVAWGGHGGSGGVGGTDGGSGGFGGFGGSATGGGAYISGGSVSGMSNSFQSDAAIGGTGGYGGRGGEGGTALRLGAGGAGGDAGNGYGGALYLASGSVSLGATPFTADLAKGGKGGSGGIGGYSRSIVYQSASSLQQVFTGRGGDAGSGGDADGGAIYLARGSLTLGVTPSITEPPAETAPVDVQYDRAIGGLPGDAGDARLTGVRRFRFGFSNSGEGFASIGSADGGAIFVAGGSLLMFNQVLSSDVANLGGAIYNEGGGSITATGLVMNSNSAEVGGALFNLGGLIIYGGTFQDNQAVQGADDFAQLSKSNVGYSGSTGGGIYNAGKLTFSGVSLSRNNAHLGGGILNASGTILANGLVLTGNQAVDRGGGIYSLAGSLTLNGGSFDDNKVTATGSSPSVAVGSGGAIDLLNGSLSLSGVSFTGNNARAGGGLYVSAGSATITNSTFSTNVGRQTGGAIYSDGTLNITGGTLSGNSAATLGGAIENFGTLTADQVNFTLNQAGTDGGAINNAATITLDEVTVTNNSAVSLGGGVNNQGVLSIAASTFSSNQAKDGGGIFNVGQLNLTDGDSISHNVASDDGGGIDNNSGGQVIATSLSVMDNTASTGNGAGIYDQRGALTITMDSEIANNVAPNVDHSKSRGWGGGIYDTGGKIALSGSPVEGNQAVAGGGLYITSGSVSLTNEQIDNNTAAQSGGGILSQGTLTLTSTTISANVATADDGGGINSQGKATLDNSTLTQNTAGADGGDIYVDTAGSATITQSTLSLGIAGTGGNAANAGTLTVTTSTIAGGTAAHDGGGIADVGEGIIRMSDSTIADNVAQGNGGGIDTQGNLDAVNVTIAYNSSAENGGGAGLDVQGGDTYLANTIIDLNAVIGNFDVAGPVSDSSAYNLFGSLSSGTTGLPANNQFDVVQPGLASGLANNGGPTQTIALVNTPSGQASPAIDAGSNALALDPSTAEQLTTDQRGALRGTAKNQSYAYAGTTVDIGAYEASSAYLVTSTADSLTLAGTLRSGVEWAGYSTNDNPDNVNNTAPNTVVFNTSGSFAIPQTIKLDSTLELPTNTTTVPVEILGPGNGVVTIAGNGTFQDITVPGGTAILQGITITGGSATDGGGVGNAGVLTLDDAVVMDNAATEGGGVYSDGTSSSLVIQAGTTIENNSSLDGGGGIYSSTPVTLTDAVIQNNSAAGVGGGIDLPSGGTLTLSGSTITENVASSGGGLYLGYVTATVTGGAVTGNSATTGGGLYSGGLGSSLVITGTSLTGNSATTGGAIDADGILSLSAATLQANSAAAGGAISAAGQTSIDASTLSSNLATGAGGAVDNTGALTVTSTTMTGNSAGSGGAIASDGTLTIGGSTLSGNSADDGGAVCDTSGTSDMITNSTLAGNSAAAGGAIYASQSALTLVNSTIAYNEVATGGTGSGLDVAAGSVSLYNTIIDLDSGLGATDINGTVAGSYDIIGTSTSGGIVNGTDGNQAGIADPGLAPALASNGGTTQTIALLPGSPAIDAGDNTIPGITVPTTDERGALRGAPDDPSYAYAGTTVDIGAYEASSAYVVTGVADNNDLGSLRTAVSWANVSSNSNPAYLALTTPAPNTVAFDTTGAFSTPQAITLSSAIGTLDLSNTATPVAIVGPTGDDLTISGGGSIGVLSVASGVTADLTDLVIADGSAASGAGIENAGTLAITGSVVTANASTGSGGGITNTGTLTLTSTSIAGNTAMGSGGGISNTGTLTLTGGSITGNVATGTGGGIADLGSAASTRLTSVTISGNTAATGGGIDNSGTLTVGGSTISSNSATAAGGGIAVQAGGSVSLSDTTVSSNAVGTATGTGTGGGIDNSGRLTLSGSTIETNTAGGSGGGVDNESGGTITASYSTLTGNTAVTANGGGLDNTGTASLSVMTVSNNLAGTTGGGVGNEVGANLSLTASTLNGNTANLDGGGLANSGDANLTNSTIAANSASSGGGIYNAGVLETINATVAYNEIAATGKGGGLDTVSGSSTLYNTIVASNATSNSLASDAIGSLAPLSAYDLFGTGGSGGLTTTALNGVVTNVKTPDLGVATNNGGPTATIALLAGSPAIDAGSASIPGVTVPIVDQRGALRGSAGLNAGTNPDIGAYEASSSYLVNTTADSTAIGTLRSAVAWANVSTNDNPENITTPQPNTVAFDTAGVFSTPQTITISSTLGPIQLSGSNSVAETINGTASRGLTISGGSQGQIFSIAAGTVATLTGLTLIDGYSSASGGALVNSGNLTVSNSTLTDNTAALGGGAIDNLGTLAVQASTLNANSAIEYGGAIDNESAGKMTLTNSTIAGNSAGQGGGIYSTGTFAAINDTVAYNASVAASSGGGLDAAGGTAALYNTIVALNTDASGTSVPDDIAGTVTGSYNLVGTGGSGGLSDGVDGNQVGVADPGLAAGLGNNGGPTQTIALVNTLTGQPSPAISAAPATADSTTITTDQRGAIRGSTNIDIGSYEMSLGYLVSNATDSTEPGTLRSAINWANANTSATPSAIPLVIQFGSSFSTPQVISLTLGTLSLTNTTRPIVIEGPGAALVTISGLGQSQVFNIASGVNLSILGVTIEDGEALSGGGIYNAGTLSLGTATVNGTTVTQGVAVTGNSSPSGSGAGVDNIGSLTVVDSSFSSNVGSYYGGAIYNDDGTAVITNTNFVDNSTLYGLGGAIDNQGGSLMVTGGTFTGNDSFQGGAIYNRDDSTTIPGTVIPATASITQATFSGNSAYQGGALFNEGTAAVPAVETVTDSTFSDNTAFQGGAASNNFGGTLNIIDSTLATNTANQYGGAIDNVGALTLISSTVAYNVVVGGGAGAGIDAYAGSTALYDTIVVLNTIGTGTSAISDDITGAVLAASSYNMIGTGGLTNGVNSNIVGTTAPGLAPALANNGGPTETIALYSGSPALGAGSATITGVAVPTTDQRGVARPATGYDIGAYQGSIPAPVKTTPTSTTTATPAATPAASLTSAMTVPSVSTSAVAPVAVSQPAEVSTPVAPTPTSTSTTVVNTTSPFKGRHIAVKGHHTSRSVHHSAVLSARPKVAAHKPASAVTVDAAKQVVTVRIKRRPR